MRKKILKGVFCSALSIVMATGGVFVSAAPKQAQVTTKIQSVQNSKIVNLQQTKTSENTKSKAQARTAVQLNNVTVPTIWNTSVKSAVKSVTLENGNDIGTITIKNAGTLVAVFQKEGCLVIGISISGESEDVFYLLEESKKRGADMFRFSS